MTYVIAVVVIALVAGVVAVLAYRKNQAKVEGVVKKAEDEYETLKDRVG